MRKTASSTRTATYRLTLRPVSLVFGRASAALLRVRVIAVVLLALPLTTLTPQAQAQFHQPSDLGMTFTQQRSKFVGSASTDYFYLRGATVDYGTNLWHGIGPAVAFNGMAVTNLRQQIDIHQVSFLGGVRYSYSKGHITPTIWNRRGSIFVEGLYGLTLATAGYYPDPASSTLKSNASGFTYALGGGINYNLYHAFELRLMSHYFVTDLPNGGSNQQKNIQVSAGVNWHFGY